MDSHERSWALDRQERSNKSGPSRTSAGGSNGRSKSSPSWDLRKIKPDPMLVKMAERQGKRIASDPRRRRGESLLDWRRRVYLIPPLTHQPIDDNVIVWRIPPLTMSAGGLVIPDELQSPNFKGVLLAMGPRARDHLVGNGIEEGHVVIWGRFAGWEHADNAQRFNRDAEIIELKSKDINGSEDVLLGLQRGEIKYIRGEDGKHQLATVSRQQLGPAEGRARKLLALAAGTDSVNEAAVARKLAKQEG